MVPSGQSKVRSGLFLGQSLEVAQDQWLAERSGQDAQLVVELGPIIVVLDRLEIGIDDMTGGSHLGPSQLVCAAPSGSGSCIGGDPKGNPMQPAPDRLAAADRPGPPRQDEKRRLSGVLGVRFVAQDLPANPQDHRPVPVDERCECRLGIVVPPLEEPLEQLPVGQAAGRAGAKERFDLFEEFH